MSDFKRGLVLFRRLNRAIDQKSAVVLILRAMLDKYGPHGISQISGYELELLIESKHIAVKSVWKNLIDFLCFEFELFNLEFRLIDDSNNEYFISYEDLQHVLAGKQLVIDSKTYSAAAAKGQIFPFLIPTKKWKWMVAGHQRMVNA